jgi:hypothetical protein
MESKETIKVPSLVNSKNFLKKNKIIPPISSKKTNSWYLNVFLIIGFILFIAFFLYNCKYGCFKVESQEPLPYSLVYKLS